MADQAELRLWIPQSEHAVTVSIRRYGHELRANVACARMVCRVSIVTVADGKEYQTVPGHDLRVAGPHRAADHVRGPRASRGACATSRCVLTGYCDGARLVGAGPRGAGLGSRAL